MHCGVRTDPNLDGTPCGLDGQIAAFIMQADRWNAGAAAQSPEAWRARSWTPAS
jgi:hypothetical protein